jgi:tetratricopeptide (TPR) repeat protein
MSSFSILIAVLGVTVVVASISVVALRTYSERRTRRRKEEVAEQVKKHLADLRNARPPEQKRVDQDNYDVEDTGHEAGQWVKESTGESASQPHGTVGQDASQTRDTELGPWATFQLGSIYDRQGEYARAEEAYQQAIDSGHPEEAPRAAFNLGILLEEREEYARAEEAYQQAIDSQHAEWAPKAAFDLGMLFENREEYARAEEAYRQAIDSEDLDAASKARLNLGVLFENREEYARAEEAYQQAINSRHPEVASKGTRNLRRLAMRSTARESGGARKKPWRD